MKGLCKAVLYLHTVIIYISMIIKHYYIITIKYNH